MNDDRALCDKRRLELVCPAYSCDLHANDLCTQQLTAFASVSAMRWETDENRVPPSTPTEPQTIDLGGLRVQKSF